MKSYIHKPCGHEFEDALWAEVAAGLGTREGGCAVPNWQAPVWRIALDCLSLECRAVNQ